MTESRGTTIEKRDDAFAAKPSTRIWLEEPCEGNPYLEQVCRLHGYKHIELLKKRSFIDVFYLLFRGELPTPDQAQLLERVMIAYINPGPRHPATRAAMSAGVGRTQPAHILPIALSVYGGAQGGGMEVEACMRYLANNITISPKACASTAIQKSLKPEEGDWRIIPGFGSYFGGIDVYADQLATSLRETGAWKYINWCFDLVHTLQLSVQVGWLKTGIAAAAFMDLGFAPRAGAGLFQLLSAPGLLAHGLEYATQPITAYPFLDDTQYTIVEP